MKLTGKGSHGNTKNRSPKDAQGRRLIRVIEEEETVERVAKIIAGQLLMYAAGMTLEEFKPIEKGLCVLKKTLRSGKKTVVWRVIEEAPADE